MTKMFFLKGLLSKLPNVLVLLILSLLFSSNASAWNLNVDGVNISSSSQLLTLAGNAGPYWRPTVRDTNFMEWAGTRYIHFITGVSGSFFMASPGAPDGSKLDLFRMFNSGSNNYKSIKIGTLSVPSESGAFYIMPGEYVVRATIGQMENPHVHFDFFPDNDTAQVINLNPALSNSAALSWMPAYYKKEVEPWIDNEFNNAALRIKAVDRLVFEKNLQSKLFDDSIDAARIIAASVTREYDTYASILAKKCGQELRYRFDPDGNSLLWNLFDQTIQHSLVGFDIFKLKRGDPRALIGIWQQTRSDANAIGTAIGGLMATDFHFERATEAFLARLLLESFIYNHRGSWDAFSLQFLSRTGGTFEEICAAAADQNNVSNFIFFNNKYKIENVKYYFDIAVEGITDWLPIRRTMKNPFPDVDGDGIPNREDPDPNDSSIPASDPIEIITPKPVADFDWDYTSPVPIGTTVTLNADKSSDPGGGSLSYQWALLEKPSGSKAVLMGSALVQSQLKPDMKGSYTIKLTVSNGHLSSAPVLEDVVAYKVYSKPELVELKEGRFAFTDININACDLKEIATLTVPAGEYWNEVAFATSRGIDVVLLADDRRMPTKDTPVNPDGTLLGCPDYSQRFDARGVYSLYDQGGFPRWTKNMSPGDKLRLAVFSHGGISNYQFTVDISINRDLDNDGVPDDKDAFPNDPAASLDSDGDGHPDSWNPGKSRADSTTGLRLDAFPNDPAASLDSDGDGYPDSWNSGKSRADSTTGLRLDAFPNDPAASLDSDGDGYPDSWNSGKSRADSTTGLRLDNSPNDSNRWDNAEPIIEPILDQVVNIGEKKVIVLSITDADGDDLTVALLNAPGFVELSEQTLFISPESGDEGVYTVTVQVQDDFGGSTWNTFIANVVNSNSPNIVPPSKTEIAQLYVATFNRAPDAEGLDYWANDSFDGNPTIEQIAASFFDQPETQALYPADNTDEEFVIAIYQNLFNREPDAEGLAYWVGQDGLGGGMHRSVMILAILNGAVGTDADIIDNKTEVGMYYVNQVGGNHVAGNKFSLANITDNAATVADAKNTIDRFNSPPPAIELSRIAVEVETGESINITISGGSGDFSVVNSNPQVAVASVSGNDLGITGLSEGNITLVVTDAEGMSADVTVTVTPSNIHPDTCGAYVAPGVWKEFDCYNLAAIGRTTNDDPFKPSWRLIGGYWQWGRKGPDPSQWYDTNTPNFAHGPTGPNSSEANSSEISGWDSSYAPDGAWSDSYKTANDQCPEGFRVPTKAQWEGVVDNNAQNNVGSWSESTTNYSAARFFGNALMLPAAGNRWGHCFGEVDYRGNSGYYWSSSESSSDHAWGLGFGRINIVSNDYRQSGRSVRCVADSEDLSPCTYSISLNSGSFNSSGGSTSVSVTASSSSCTWNTSNNLSWVDLSPTSGIGSQTIKVTVGANNGAARSGTITLAGKLYNINQAAASLSFDVTGKWQYTAKYAGCNTEATGEMLISLDRYSYSGQDWHHNCSITGGYYETGTFSISSQENQFGFQAAIQKVYDQYYGKDSFSVKVTKYTINRIDIEFHDNFDGSLEIMTLVRDDDSPIVSSSTFLVNAKGGGGYYTTQLLKFQTNGTILKILGKGTTDANDEHIRIGISETMSNFFDIQASDWKEVPSSYYNDNHFYTKLDSKWGTNHDTVMDLQVTIKGDNPDLIWFDEGPYDDGLDYVEITLKDSN